MICGEFEITICSDEDYEALICEIYYRGKLLFIISQEEGKENALIEVHVQEWEELLRMPLSELETAIEAAKHRLWGSK